MNAPKYFAQFSGYLCTASKDGSIPLNAVSIAFVGLVDDEVLLQQLIDQANEYAELAEQGRA